MPRAAARDHAKKRAALRKGAAAYFAAEGYDRASVADVAHHCGVSKGLIYHYYAGKEELLADIIESHLLKLRDALRDGPEKAEVRLRWLTATILATYDGADAEHQLQISNLAVVSEASQGRIHAIQREIVSEVAETLCALQPALADDEARTRAVAMSLFGMVNWAYLWRRDGRDLSRADYAEMVSDMVLGGLDRIMKGSG
jgi:AcrR family transcriptional regulator